MYIRLIIILILVVIFSKDLKSNEFNIIRDAEIENFLKDISSVLLESVDTKENNLEFYLDNKKYINASVIPGPKFFFTTRLLLDSESLDQIAGVVAHELGHVIGGHFTKINKAYEDSALISILSTILAIGATVGGSPEAGNALILGGQHLSQANLLSFSRTQESFADQTSIRLLNSSGFSINGLVQMFKLLEKNEKFKRYNPYFLTHPLSSKRKQDVKVHAKNQKNIKQFPELNKRYKLIKAKLNGFFLDKKILQNRYNKIDNIESFYAFSLRNYKIGKIKKAIQYIDKCIEIKPKNPYFRELKGQIYYENGNIRDAIKEFRYAIDLSPNEKSFKLFLAKALYNQNNSESFDESVKLLWNYIKNDNFPLEAWHYLGLNYGKLKKFDYSSYAFAEKFFLVNQIKNAKIHMEKVKKISKDPFILNKIADLEYEINKKENSE